MYDNKSEKGGRPNCDVIMMFKILILQKWYGLRDLEVERQMADRISFMAFLGFPDPFPDSRTIWLFKQRIADTGKDKMVWLSSKDSWMLWVCKLRAERFKMQHSSRQILVLQRSLVAMKLRPVAVEMEPGLRKEMRLISAISCIKKPISIQPDTRNRDYNCIATR